MKHDENPAVKNGRIFYFELGFRAFNVKLLMQKKLGNLFVCTLQIADYGVQDHF